MQITTYFLAISSLVQLEISSTVILPTTGSDLWYYLGTTTVTMNHAFRKKHKTFPNREQFSHHKNWCGTHPHWRRRDKGDFEFPSDSAQLNTNSPSSVKQSLPARRAGRRANVGAGHDAVSFIAATTSQLRDILFTGGKNWSTATAICYPTYTFIRHSTAEEPPSKSKYQFALPQVPRVTLIFLTIE